MKTSLSLAVWMLVLLSGCTGMNSDYEKFYYVPSQTTPQLLGNGRRLESIPVADHPCEPANVYFIDEARGVRQVVIDWDKLGQRSTYTLPRKGRDDLVKRIQKAGQGCTMPALIESKHINDTHVGETNHYETYSFVRYWLDGDIIRLKARDFLIETDPQTKQIKSAGQRIGLTDIDPQTGQLRMPPAGDFSFDRWKDLNTSWGYDPYNGPIASPHVAYRIDKHRFFEEEPQRQDFCGEAWLYYTDTVKGIHSSVMPARYGSDTVIIDAANDQYLVAPILPSSSGCQSGGSDKCASRMYYSQDSGRTWKQTISLMSDDVLLVGSMAYVKDISTEVVDISKPVITRDDWTRESGKGFVIPKPRKAPIDTKFRCNSYKEE